MSKETVKTLFGLDKIETINHRLPEEQVFCFSDIARSLENPGVFHNKKVNRVVTYTDDLVTNYHINLTVDTELITPAHFIVFEYREMQVPTIVLPINFTEQTIEDPINQIMRVTYCASLAADYWLGKRPAKIQDLNDNANNITSNLRANTYRSETLMTIQQMMLLRGERIELDTEMKRLLFYIPNGFSGTHSDLYCSPPNFKPSGMDM